MNTSMTYICFTEYYTSRILEVLVDMTRGNFRGGIFLLISTLESGIVSLILHGQALSIKIDFIGPTLANFVQKLSD